MFITIEILIMENCTVYNSNQHWCIIYHVFTVDICIQLSRAETRALIGGGGGGGYSYIRILLVEFLLKSVAFRFISKEISREKHTI